MTLPDQNIPAPDTITISVIVSEAQLRWRSVRLFLEGLQGPLARGEIYVDPETTARNGSRLLSGLVALERVFLPRGQLSEGIAIDRELPRRTEEIAPCDIIVDFRAAAAPAKLCHRARLGLWTFSCHDEAGVFQAVARGKSAVECQIFQQVGDSGTRQIIDSMLVQSKHSIASTLTFASEKSVQLALHHLRRLALRQGLLAGADDKNPRAISGPTDFLRYSVHLMRFVAARAIARIWPAARKSAPFVLRSGKGHLPDINPASGTDLPRPANTFCADPFLFEKDGEVYCFYEEFPYDTRLGKIAVALLTDGGAARLGDALTAHHHLSFPYVFEHEGEIFMLPETMQANRLEVWRCTDFPLGWELHATAFEGQRLADSVLFRKGSDWWLFANVSHDSFGDFSSELNLYKVDGPDLKEIVPHPLNPVVVGSDVARGGGRVFEHGGRIYRHSQDNSGDIYGYGLNLMEITELSETDYREQRVMHYTPDCLPGTVGCHHADAAGGRFIVDIRLA